MTKRIDPVALSIMQARGGEWAVYENKAIDSLNLGHLQFLKVGPGCTYLNPPTTYPADTPHGMGWRYLYVGKLDLGRGDVLEENIDWRHKAGLVYEDPAASPEEDVPTFVREVTDGLGACDNFDDMEDV